MLETFKGGLRTAVGRLTGSTAVDADAVRQLKKDVQKALIMSDVDTQLTFDVSKRLETRALGEVPPPGLSRKEQVVKILYEELSGLLGRRDGEDGEPLPVKPGATNRILLLGIQGSGKTTTCAKLAKLLSGRGHTVGVIGADNYRPGALVQLRTMCEKAKTEVYGSESQTDSAKIVRDGLAHFGDSKDVVIIDTAGRHKEEKDLLDEMGRISSVAKPDMSLLVIDGTIGQQCFRQAEAFHGMVPVGGIIITKLDSSGKGGGALAAAAATGARIMFVSNGERIDDLEQFSPTRFVGRMLGMGDIKAVLDLAKKLEEAADGDRSKRIYRGKMTLMDFLNEMESVKGAGSMRDLMDSIPAFAGKMKDSQIAKAEENTEKWRYIIQSMTEDEWTNPDVLNRSRLRRIARGSGWSEHDVKFMIKNFTATKSMIKSNKGRKMQGMLRRMGLG